MQQINYLALRALAARLESRLVGARCVYCFSQQKDEVVLFFKKDKIKTYLRVGCKGDMQYVVPQDDYRRAHKNTVTLFTEIENKTVIEARVTPGERIFVLRFEEEWRLALKMHGNRANVILLQGETVVSIFRATIEEDAEFRLPALVEPTLAQPLTPETLKALHPYFDKFLVARAELLAASGATFDAAVAQTLAEALADPFYVAELGTGEIGFFLNPPPEEFPLVESGPMLETLTTFLRLFFGRRAFLQLRRKIGSKVQEGYRSARARLQSDRQSLHKSTRKRSDEEIAHILMANLHAVPSGAKEIECWDFYLEAPIRIPLDPNLSPQENAALLYQKHKELRKKISFIEKSLEEAELEAMIWAEIRAGFDAAPSAGALQALAKKYPEELGENPTKGKKPVVLPFKVFQYGVYAIWVGRNAQNNDLLTFGYAKKDDIWLHARDCPGSHVVLRKPNRQNLPPDAIEYAAGIAAYFSRRRKSEYVEVSYTERRYLRKNKKLAPGQVVVEKEKTLVVSPIPPPTE